MALQYLMQVPARLLGAVHTGSAYVEGAVVKSAGSHHVLAHLQQSGRLAQALASGPVGAGSAVVQAASSVVANVQLEQVKAMLSTLQVISGVGAAASVLNLGVSVGGFALVLSRLRRLDERVAHVAQRIEGLQQCIDRSRVAHVLTALERCETAFDHSEAERQRIWREEERHLHEAVTYAFLYLFADDLAVPPAESAPSRARLWERIDLSANEIAEALSWPLLYAQARLEVLLLLNEPLAAQRFAERIHRSFGRVDLEPLAYVKARRGGVALGAAEVPRALDEARGLERLLTRASKQAQEQSALCAAMIERQIESRQLVEEVREHHEATVLMLPVAEIDG